MNSQRPENDAQKCPVPLGENRTASAARRIARLRMSRHGDPFFHLLSVEKSRWPITRASPLFARLHQDLRARQAGADGASIRHAGTSFAPQMRNGDVGRRPVQRQPTAGMPSFRHLPQVAYDERVEAIDGSICRPPPRTGSRKSHIWLPTCVGDAASRRLDRQPQARASPLAPVCAESRNGTPSPAASHPAFPLHHNRDHAPRVLVLGRHAMPDHRPAPGRIPAGAR